MDKLLKGMESTDVGLSEIKSYFLSMSQLVGLHSTSIKQLEQQMNKLSATLNQRKSGTLPCDTVQNPRNNSLFIAIPTRSGKILPRS